MQEATPNAKVLYKHFIDIGRTGAAENLKTRWAGLEDIPIIEPEPVVEVSNGKKSKR